MTDEVQEPEAIPPHEEGLPQVDETTNPEKDEGDKGAP